MREYNFLPLWYRSKIEKKEQIRFKVFLSTMIFLISINIFRVMQYTRNIQDIADDISSINLRNTQSKKVQHKVNKNKEYTIDAYYTLKQELKGIFKFNNITITKDKILVEKEFENINEATELLHCLECSTKFRIIDINMEDLDNKKVLLKLNLKAGKYE